jgi:hypothetical protein
MSGSVRHWADRLTNGSKETCPYPTTTIMWNDITEADSLNSHKSVVQRLHEVAVVGNQIDIDDSTEADVDEEAHDHDYERPLLPGETATCEPVISIVIGSSVRDHIPLWENLGVRMKSTTRETLVMMETIVLQTVTQKAWP